MSIKLNFFERMNDKWKLFFFWLFSSPTKLYVPVKCGLIIRKKQSLMGRSYYFYHLESYKIRSPMEGYIKKIFSNQSLLIVNNYGLQILLSFSLSDEKKKNVYETLERKVEEGDKVNPKKILFIIYQEKEIINVAVYVYWQPWILKKMGKLERKKSYFTSCYYRNPFSKLKWKRHGRY